MDFDSDPNACSSAAPPHQSATTVKREFCPFRPLPISASSNDDGPTNGTTRTVCRMRRPDQRAPGSASRTARRLRANLTSCPAKAARKDIHRRIRRFHIQPGGCISCNGVCGTHRFVKTAAPLSPFHQNVAKRAVVSTTQAAPTPRAR